MTFVLLTANYSNLDAVTDSILHDYTEVVVVVTGTQILRDH